MSGEAQYLSNTFQREGESLETYMETVRDCMLNQGVQNPIEALKDAYGSPDYSISLDQGGSDTRVDPEQAYVQVVEGRTVEEYVLVGREQGAVGVLSNAGGHILHDTGEADHYRVTNTSNSLVHGDGMVHSRNELFYQLIEHWEDVQNQEHTGRGYVDLSDADEEDIRVLGQNAGVLEAKYGSILDELQANGEVALSADTHLGNESERGNHILQNIRGVVRRMDDDRGIDPARIERDFDENTPTLRYQSPAER